MHFLILIFFNFHEKILKIGFFSAKKHDRHLQWRSLYPNRNSRIFYGNTIIHESYKCNCQP